MTSGLLFVLILGIGGNMFCEARPEAQRSADLTRTPGSESLLCFLGFCRRCPSGWTRYGDHCYIFENNALAWADAEKLCNTFNGHLTSIQDSDQYNFIRELIFSATGSNTPSWVGGTNAVREDLWMWTDGTQFTFNSWGPGEPNNQGGDEHCMEINLNGIDYVNDLNCSQQNSFVCVKNM